MHDRSKREKPPSTGVHEHWLLDQFYTVPDPLRSFEDWERFRHVDLAEGKIPEELMLERDRLRARLQLDEHPHSWLFERLSVIEGLIRDVA